MMFLPKPVTANQIVDSINRSWLKNGPSRAF